MACCVNCDIFAWINFWYANHRSILSQYYGALRFLIYGISCRYISYVSCAKLIPLRRWDMPQSWSHALRQLTEYESWQGNQVKLPNRYREGRISELQTIFCDGKIVLMYLDAIKWPRHNENGRKQDEGRFVGCSVGLALVVSSYVFFLCSFCLQPK